MENYKLNIREYISKKISSNYWKFLILIFGIVFTIAPGDYYNNAIDRSIVLHNILLKGIIFNEHFFSIFDILIILISIKIIRDFGLSLKSAKSGEKLIFFFSILCFIFLMINPNNSTSNPVLGMPLFSDVSNYSHLIFLTAIFFVKFDDAFIIFFKKFTKAVLILILIWSFYLLILWLMGRGNFGFFGVNSILTEDDTLFIIGFAQIVFLALYLIKKEKYLLISSIFLFIVQVLSFRRSGLFVAILASSTLLLIYYVKYISTTKKITTFVLAAITGLSLSGIIFNYNPTSNVQFYFYRFFGMFLQNSGTTEIDSDSGHFAHSQWVFDEAVNRLGFWGLGYSDDTGSIVYQAGIHGVHNAYVAMWLYRGLMGLALILVIIGVFVIQIIRTVISRNKYPPDFLLIRSAVISFFLYFLVSIFYLSVHHLIDIREIVLRTLIIAFLYKVTPDNYKLLID